MGGEHILTISHGEVYVQHFWLLFFLAFLVFRGR